MTLNHDEERGDWGWTMGNANANEEGLSNKSNANDRMWVM